MNEIESKINTPKSKYSKTAILIFILGLSSLYIIFMREPLRFNIKYSDRLLILKSISVFTFITGLFVLLIKRSLKGRGFAITGTLAAALSLILGLTGLFPRHEPPLPSMLCVTNLSGLGKAMVLYAYDHNGRYPEADKWCDLLILYEDLNPSSLVCKGSDAILNESSYAINPDCDPNSPWDMVLLFETNFGKNPVGRDDISGNRYWYKALSESSVKMVLRRLRGIKPTDKIYKERWNQAGEQDILTTENHDEQGCFILFNDYHVEFIKKENLGDLRWKAEEQK